VSWNKLWERTKCRSSLVERQSTTESFTRLPSAGKCSPSLLSLLAGIPGVKPNKIANRNWQSSVNCSDLCPVFGWKTCYLVLTGPCNTPKSKFREECYYFRLGTRVQIRSLPSTCRFCYQLKNKYFCNSFLFTPLGRSLENISEIILPVCWDTKFKIYKKEKVQTRGSNRFVLGCCLVPPTFIRHSRVIIITTAVQLRVALYISLLTWNNITRLFDTLI
jgi:hypothetical protein